MAHPLSPKRAWRTHDVSNDANKTEVMRQITAAWDLARSQLEELKAAVARHSELASVKLQGTFLQREKDQALRDFGEAVFQAVQKGQLQLPQALAGAYQAVTNVDRKLEFQAAEVATLLAEGTEHADRLNRAAPPRRTGMQPAAKGVAPATKRR